MKDLSQYERPNAVSGLLAKHQELQIFHARLLKEAKTVQDNIKHLEPCIRLLDPDAEITSTKPERYAPRLAAPRGQLKRFILSMLREAEAPASSRQVADAWAVDQSKEVDRNTINLLRKRIGNCIQSIKRDKLIVRLTAMVCASCGN